MTTKTNDRLDVRNNRLTEIEASIERNLRLAEDLRARVAYLEGYIAGRADAGNPVAPVAAEGEGF